MRNHLIIFIIFLFLLSCKQDKPADIEVEEMTQTAEELSQTFTERIPQMTDELKVKIYELQERIKIDPENVDLRKQFCETAYSADNMVMLTMGLSRMTDPETGEKINRGMVERAAQIDATRWALFATNWLMYDYQPAFTEINGNFTRKSQVIDKVVVGDSLFLYLASDLSK